MSKLTAIRKQIAALEAQAERLAKTETAAAIGKVKALMSDFGLTIEHLAQSVVGKRAGAKTVQSAKRTKVASAAKYADPKSGKTWSGFGRAPGWIAGAKNRDAFLVTKVAAPTKAAAVKLKKTTKTATKAVSSVAKYAATKSAASGTAAAKKVFAKKTAAKTAAASKGAAGKTSLTAKKVAAKKSAKATTVAKKAAPRKAEATVATAALPEISTNAD